MRFNVQIQYSNSVILKIFAVGISRLKVRAPRPKSGNGPQLICDSTAIFLKNGHQMFTFLKLVHIWGMASVSSPIAARRGHSLYGHVQGLKIAQNGRNY